MLLAFKYVFSFKSWLRTWHRFWINFVFVLQQKNEVVLKCGFFRRRADYEKFILCSFWLILRYDSGLVSVIIFASQLLFSPQNKIKIMMRWHLLVSWEQVSLARTEHVVLSLSETVWIMHSTILLSIVWFISRLWKINRNKKTEKNVWIWNFQYQEHCESRLTS